MIVYQDHWATYSSKPSSRQRSMSQNSAPRATLYAAEPAPVTEWFHDQTASGAQPRRMNGPMSPVAMNVPVRNQVLTTNVETTSTTRYGRLVRAQPLTAPQDAPEPVPRAGQVGARGRERGVHGSVRRSVRPCSRGPYGSGWQEYRRTGTR